MRILQSKVKLALFSPCRFRTSWWVSKLLWLADAVSRSTSWFMSRGDKFSSPVGHLLHSQHFVLTFPSFMDVHLCQISPIDVTFTSEVCNFSTLPWYQSLVILWSNLVHLSPFLYHFQRRGYKKNICSRILIILLIVNYHYFNHQWLYHRQLYQHHQFC